MSKKVNTRAKARLKELKREKERNKTRKIVKKGIKKQLNFIFSLGEAVEVEEKQKALSKLYKTVDSKASKGLISKKRADRLKSKCAIKINSLSPSQEL